VLIENFTINKFSDSQIVGFCLFLAGLIFIIDSLIPLGVAGGVPYILVVLISLWSPRIKLPISMAILGSILTIVGFYTSPSGGELWSVLFNRSLALLAIWAVAIMSLYRESMEAEKRKALFELKMLRGMLPICASCKNIRDKKGRWHRIESYLKGHSEVEFSHSICPDCARDLYPDIELYGGKKKLKGNGAETEND